MRRIPGRLSPAISNAAPGHWLGWSQGWPGCRAGSVRRRSVNTTYRDHIRSLQLLRQALPSVRMSGKHPADLGLISASFAALMAEAWKLQTLTPIDTLPEWGEPGPEGGTEGAPWAKDGPVLYEVPASWEAAKNDGERWRFALAEQSTA